MPSSWVATLSTVIITVTLTIICYPILECPSCTLSHRGHSDSIDTIPILTFGKKRFMPLPTISCILLKSPLPSKLLTLETRFVELHESTLER